MFVWAELIRYRDTCAFFITCTPRSLPPQTQGDGYRLHKGSVIAWTLCNGRDCCCLVSSAKDDRPKQAHGGQPTKAE